MTNSKIFLFSLLSFITGVFLASFFNLPFFLVLEIFAIGGVFIFLFFEKKDKRILVFGLCFILLGAGILRMDANKPITEDKLYGEEVKSEKVFSGFKDNLRSKVYRNFSPPASSFLLALTIGDKQKISEKWKEKLNKAGVRHIMVISGMHIFILSSMFFFLCSAFGCSNKKKFLLSLFFLWGFVWFVGFQSSCVRAAIFASFFFLAQSLKRQKSSLRILVFAAFLMLLFDPLLLRYDVGFQLSFLAVLGISTSFSYFKNLLTKIIPESLASLVGVTISAQIFTIPLLLYYFGFVSFASLFANVLIVPFLPLIMGLGFLFLILPIVSFVFYYPLYLLLLYMKWAIVFFSSLELFHLDVVSSAFYFLLYIPIILFIVKNLNKHSKICYN